MDRPITDILRKQTLVALGPEVSVRHAAVVMAENAIGAVPVTSGGRLVGIFSERDIMTRVVAHGLDTGATAIGEVMTPAPITVGSHGTMSRALRLMRDAGVRHLPVVDGDILLGMVSARDARPAQLADFASPPPYREVALENLL